MWEQIRYNQRRTVLLFFYLGAIWLLLGFVFGILASYFSAVSMFQGGMYGVLVAAVLWLFVFWFAYTFGDRILLAMAGAKKITIRDLHRVSNIVDEMQIAAGLEYPPDTYVIEDPALNAFAIGRDANKAAIILTSGLLTKLNRDELQGVVGHEIAHIKNRDVLLMSLCATILGAIEITTWFFSPKRIYRASGMAEEGEGCFFLIVGMLIAAAIFLAIAFHNYMTILYYDLPPLRSFAVTLLVIFLAIPSFMLFTPLLAKLIYYAISRRREYLADASSALYTRYPEGLASALEKIAKSTNQLMIASKATAAMFTVNPFREHGMAASDITNTHPPISRRIAILRAMAYASYIEYDRAYREIGGVDKSVIPSSVMALAGTDVRPALDKDLDRVHRARETSNLLWNLNNYRLITCDCGTRMRLPPGFKLTEVKCPHCGKIIPVPAA